MNLTRPLILVAVAAWSLASVTPAHAQDAALPPPAAAPMPAPAAEPPPAAQALPPTTLPSVPAVSPGSLEVVSDPPGAVVLVDGRPAGRTPTRVDGLVPGTHHVQVTLEGGSPMSRSVVIQDGTTSRLDLNLTGNPARAQTESLGGAPAPAATPAKKDGPSFLPNMEFFSTFTAQPWAWAAAALAGVALLVAAILWTTSDPGSVWGVGTYLKDVKSEQWRVVQIGALVVAGLTGVVAVLLFMWPSLPFAKYLPDPMKLITGKKDDKAQPGQAAPTPQG